MGKGRLTALIAALITILMLAFPDESFKASLARAKALFTSSSPIAAVFAGRHLMGLECPLEHPEPLWPASASLAKWWQCHGACGIPIGACTGSCTAGPVQPGGAERLLANTADPLYCGRRSGGHVWDAEIGAAFIIGHYLGR